MSKPTVLQQIDAIRFSKYDFKHAVAVTVNFDSGVITAVLGNGIIGIRTATFTNPESVNAFLADLAKEFDKDHNDTKAKLEKEAAGLINKVIALDAVRDDYKSALTGSNHNKKVIAAIIDDAKAQDEADLARIAATEARIKALEAELESLKAN